MTSKQIALLHVGKLLAIALVGGIAINILFVYFTLTEIGIGFCIGLLAFLIKMVYTIEYEHAESLRKLNDSVDNR